MPEAMTKERLEELQDLAYDAVGGHAEKVYGEALSEACSEIERMQALITQQVEYVVEAAHSCIDLRDEITKLRTALTESVACLERLCDFRLQDYNDRCYGERHVIWEANSLLGKVAEEQSKS
jgi:hypothetical protein